jgi:hypothetical protein
VRGKIKKNGGAKMPVWVHRRRYKALQGVTQHLKPKMLRNVWKPARARQCILSGRKIKTSSSEGGGVNQEGPKLAKNGKLENATIDRKRCGCCDNGASKNQVKSHCPHYGVNVFFLCQRKPIPEEEQRVSVPVTSVIRH